MNTQDGIGIHTKRQTQQKSTKNKMERSTASSILSSHRTGPRCPTSVYVHDDDEDDDDEKLALKKVVQHSVH
jgi:hypothetical protein